MVRCAHTWLVILVALLVSGCEKKPRAERDAGIQASPHLPPFADRPRALDFYGATAWLNVERPVTPADLDGRVVVVDFWTSCCINCLHTLPILSALEKKHAGAGLVVIGVHSPKFDVESEQERLRSAIAENDIAHPVAVDGSMKIWTRWKAQGWPTIVVLDAKGRIVWTKSGEPKPAELGDVVSAALDEATREGILKRGPIPGLKIEAPDTGPLAFPGKIVALSGGGFALSDTGHHRIVILDRDFAVKDVVGTGLAGATDGGYAEASFKKPQGIAELGDLLYVADTENHLVRAIDPKKKTVTTVAGTGVLGGARLEGKTPSRIVSLRSPWDLLVIDGALWIALAGSHQLGLYDPTDQTVALVAGNGAERRADGAALDASFAQPSGLATDGTTVWIADSETSSIRAVAVASKSVKTVVGKDLFVFGDKDGSADLVRLEHPLGVAYGAPGPKGARPAVWIADTYNSKIKRIEPATGSTRTVVGARTHEALFEPSGLLVVGAGLVVVDTRHHRLARVVIDAEGNGKVEPITIRGLGSPTRGIAVAGASDAGGLPPLELVEIPEVRIRADAVTKVKVAWRAPPGTGVNEDAPFRVRWNRSDGLIDAPKDVKATGSAAKEGFTVDVKPMTGAPNATLGGEIDLVVCDVKTHSSCVPVRRKLELGFIVAKDALTDAKVTVPLPQAKAN